MNKKIIVFLTAAALIAGAAGAFAQSATTTNLNPEASKGRDLWNKILDKTLGCSDLNDSDFKSIGQYAVSINGVSGAGNDDSLTALGKRFSGCDPNAYSSGYGPMMRNFGWNGWGGMMGWNGWNNMMNGGFGFPFGLIGIAFSIFWALVVAALVILAIRGVLKVLHSSGFKRSESAIEILKERYAKGEINKEEFEEKKKDLG